MKLIVEVPPAQHPPRGYGLVRFDYTRNISICAPVPLNVAWRLWDAFASWMVCGVFMRRTYRERLDAAVASEQEWKRLCLKELGRRYEDHTGR